MARVKQVSYHSGSPKKHKPALAQLVSKPKVNTAKLKPQLPPVNRSKKRKILKSRKPRLTKFEFALGESIGCVGLKVKLPEIGQTYLRFLTCPRCAKSYPTVSAAAECLKSHNYTRCGLCFDAIRNNSSVIDYVKQIHYDAGCQAIVKCPVYRLQEYADLAELCNHIADIHTDVGVCRDHVEEVVQKSSHESSGRVKGDIDAESPSASRVGYIESSCKKDFNDNEYGIPDKPKEVAQGDDTSGGYSGLELLNRGIEISQEIEDQEMQVDECSKTSADEESDSSEEDYIPIYSKLKDQEMIDECSKTSVEENRDSSDEEYIPIYSNLEDQEMILDDECSKSVYDESDSSEEEYVPVYSKLTSAQPQTNVEWGEQQENKLPEEDEKNESLSQDRCIKSSSTSLVFHCTILPLQTAQSSPHPNNYLPTTLDVEIQSPENVNRSSAKACPNNLNKTIKDQYQISPAIESAPAKPSSEISNLFQSPPNICNYESTSVHSTNSCGLPDDDIFKVDTISSWIQSSLGSSHVEHHVLPEEISGVATQKISICSDSHKANPQPFGDDETSDSDLSNLFEEVIVTKSFYLKHFKLKKESNDKEIDSDSMMISEKAKASSDSPTSKLYQGMPFLQVSQPTFPIKDDEELENEEPPILICYVPQAINHELDIILPDTKLIGCTSLVSTPIGAERIYSISQDHLIKTTSTPTSADTSLTNSSTHNTLPPKHRQKTLEIETTPKKNELLQSEVSCKIAFECSYCDKQFCSKYSLERHEKIHTGIRLFNCNLCPAHKGFGDSWSLRRHAQNVHHIVIPPCSRESGVVRTLE